MSNQTFDFSEALKRMRQGKKVRREIWEECGAYICICSKTIIAVVEGKFSLAYSRILMIFSQQTGRRWKDELR